MRFMVMHKHDVSTEQGKMPSGEFMQEMGGLIGDLLKNGVMKDGAGLGKSINRTRVTFKNGERTVVDGPFGGPAGAGNSNQLVTSFFQIKAKTRAEAVEWASKLGRALGGDVDIEVGKTTENWDLGFEPEPPNPPFNALLLVKADARSEAGQPLAKSAAAAVDALKREMTDAGVLTSAATLTPSSKGSRIHMDRKGKKQIVDGPFTESKELVGGFALLEMPSKEAVVEFAWKYGALMLKSVETLEMDIRPVEG